MKSSIRDNSEGALVILKPKYLKFIALLKSIPIAVFLGLIGGIGVLMVTLIASGQPPSPKDIFVSSFQLFKLFL